jgi:hypothetical protein
LLGEPFYNQCISHCLHELQHLRHGPCSSPPSYFCENYVSVDILRTITNNRKVGNAYERIPFPATIALPSSLQPRKGNYANKAYQTEARCWRCYRRNIFATFHVSIIVSTIAISISTISISIARSRIVTIYNTLRAAGASAFSVCKSGCRRHRCYCLSDVCD